MYVNSKVNVFILLSTLLIVKAAIAQTASDPCAFTRPTCDPNTYQEVTEEIDGKQVTKRITIPNGNRGCALEHQAYNSAFSQCQSSKAAGNTTANFDAKNTLGPEPVNNCGPQPKAEDEVGSNLASWHSCNQQYQYQMGIYNAKKAIVEQQTAAATIAQEEENKKKIQQAKETATSFAANQNNTQKGDMLYKIVSQVTGQLGKMEVQQGVQCASGCPYGCCSSAPMHFAKAAAYFALMAAAQSQSQRMNKSGHDSCTSYNAVASDKQSCGPSPIMSDPLSDPNFPANTLTGLVGPDGKCLPTAPPSCQDTIAEIEKRTGTNIKDLNKGLSAFAGGKGPIKFKDGKIVLPNGKAFTPEELMTEQGLKAAGLSASEANAFLAKNKEQMTSFKPFVFNKPKIESSSYGMGDLNSSSGGKGSIKGGPNGNFKGEKEVSGTEREPASAEGLVKDFYGELIGVAGDDIFKMMNRRYKLKTAQDSFIGP